MKRLLLLACLLAALPALAAGPAPVDRDAPENAGRKGLSDYLDRIAAGYTAARRQAVEAIVTKDQALTRQRQVHETLLKLLGPLPDRTPLNARSLGVTQLDGFRIEKILFESQPGFAVTALLYLPDTPADAKLPAILLTPGHGAPGKASDTFLATTFVRNGFAVLSYDPIGQGERLQYPDPGNPGQSLATRPTGEHGEMAMQPLLIGRTSAAFFLWDGIRAVDYLQSRPEVDKDRIGAFGCSGGGAITALLGAVETRLKAIGSACYVTSFDRLLPSIGPQDSEQSIPRFISSGLDFPDWPELAAPRPYAIVSTTEDMFPFAGAQASEAEVRRFYRLFDAESQLEFITGPGGHGNLKPIAGKIIGFFLKHLRPGAYPVPPTEAPQIPAEALQVLNGKPVPETVHSLSLKQFHALPPRPVLRGEALKDAVREIAGFPAFRASATPEEEADSHHLTWTGDGGVQGRLILPKTPGRHPAVLLLRPSTDVTPEMERLAHSGKIVLILCPRPSPPGTEETKSPVLGGFYLTETRAELVGKTLIGLRMEDIAAAVDYLGNHPDVDKRAITAEADGALGVALLHEAVIDPRLAYITLQGSLTSYRNLMEVPLPRDLPEILLPGVLLSYDLPDLIAALKNRVTAGTPQKKARAAQPPRP